MIYASARRHGIADTEIRAVIEHPIVRYRLAPRAEPDARLVRMIGDPAGGPLIEVVADRVDADELHVFQLEGSWICPMASVAVREHSGRKYEQR